MARTGQSSFSRHNTAALFPQSGHHTTIVTLTQLFRWTIFTCLQLRLIMPRTQGPISVIPFIFQCYKISTMSVFFLSPENQIFMERTPEGILPPSLKSTSASSGSAVIYSTYIHIYIHIHILHLGHTRAAIQKRHWVKLYPEWILGLILKEKLLINVRK